tara:strand:- start:23 stop:502 length:480 start_codon:yes stop_codon:yes gene_type:complete
MMGSGKSSIGKLLSKKLNFEFIDIDQQIEEIEKNTIVEIFSKKGEKYFRNLEENISIKSLKLKNKIISLGGGGYINPNIRKNTVDNSTTIWLNWKSTTLINRIKNSKKRPIAIKLNTFKLKKLIFERSKIYDSSDFKINCDKLDKIKIVNKIIKLYENS